MNYLVDLFSPETAEAFSKSGQDVTGFRISQKSYVEKNNIGPGDMLICYITRIQRFVGLLEIKSESFIEETPIFSVQNDPFVLRFKVEPKVWLPLEKSVPIHEDFIWDKLSFTKDLSKSSNQWTHKVFASPRLWSKEDGEFLKNSLLEQSMKLIDYPLSERDKKLLKVHKIKINNKREVIVSVPDDPEEELIETKPIDADKRESIKIQAKLSEIGSRLGMKIWLPSGDRTNVLDLWKPEKSCLLDELPFSFDKITLKTIENIDVLWVSDRTIVRAFEVEDTTSIYSGILRMADLLSLLPNIDVKIHIVAPLERREKVFKQIVRPVFAMMSKPLSECCSYLSYDSVIELANEKRLEQMKDIIIEEYLEYPADN